MELSDLENGANIVLEIVWGERTYQINSTVVGKGSEAILLKPFTYGGTVLDLNGIQFRDMLYNIYGVDRTENVRLVWKNVQIETKEYKNEIYYAVRTSKARRFAMTDERRNHKRMLLDISGNLLFGKEELKIPVVVHDVSDSGISFLVQGEPDFPSKMIRIEFDDEVRGHDFHLQVDSRMVRRVTQGEAELVGCRIVQTGREFLSYICLKKMNFEAEIREKAKEAEEMEQLKESQKETKAPESEKAAEQKPPVAETAQPAKAAEQKPFVQPIANRERLSRIKK